MAAGGRLPVRQRSLSAFPPIDLEQLVVFPLRDQHGSPVEALLAHEQSLRPGDRYHPGLSASLDQVRRDLAVVTAVLAQDVVARLHQAMIGWRSLPGTRAVLALNFPFTLRK